MESDTNFNEKFPSFPNFLHENHLKPKLADGFSIKSTSGFNPNLPSFEQFTTNIEGSSSNQFFHTSFYDPFDPFQASSSAAGFSKEYNGASEFMNESENRFMNESENRGVLNLFSKNSVQSMDQREINRQLIFRDFQLLKVNSPEEVSCITAKKDNTNKVVMQTKRRNKVHHNFNVIKGQWTREEDRLLVKFVEQHGVRKWSHIAQMLPGRIGKQCRERWHNHLRPDIKKDKWTEEEDKILIEAHKQMGNRWAELARRLPGRSENTIKNHWNATKRRQLSSGKVQNSKFNSPLQNYIQSLISTSSQEQQEEEENPFSDTTSQLINTMIDRDIQYGFGSMLVDAHYDHAVDDEGKLEIGLPLELGTQMQFEVRKEMDFLEMLYQDV